jgi:hypothetical protein
LDGAAIDSHSICQEGSSHLLGNDSVENLTEQGQSSNFPDNLAAETHFLLDKSEGQLSENTITGCADFSQTLSHHLGGVPELVSADSGDPLVAQANLEHLRR